jgi:hypothetical protein
LATTGHRGVVYRDPYGVTLIIGPFNGPLLLLLHPAITALTAGNCCGTKLSMALEATASLLMDLVPKNQRLLSPSQDAAKRPQSFLSLHSTSSSLVPEPARSWHARPPRISLRPSPNSAVRTRRGQQNHHRNLRLEKARFMPQQGRLPVEEIAKAAGFGDRERMRRSFQRTFGKTPRSLRNAPPSLAEILYTSHSRCPK